MAVKQEPVAVKPVVAPQSRPSNPHITSDAMDESAAYSTRNCAVYMTDDTSAEIVFKLDGQELKRIRSRCSTRNLADYFWSEILQRAINGHVY